MKTLALLLALLSSGLHASADVAKGLYWNSLCSTENSYADGSGFSNPISSGQTLSFDAVTFQEGAYSAKGFAGCCSTMNTVDPATWASNTSLTAQCFFRTSSTAVAMAVYGYANLALSQWNGWVVLGDGSIQLSYYGSTTISTTGLIAANTNYYMAAHWGADGTKFFLTANPMSQSNPGGTPISNTPILSASGIGVFAAHPNAMQVGRYSPSGSPVCASCYIDSMRVSVGDMPTLPTSDMHVPAATPTPSITPTITPTVTPTITQTATPTFTATQTVTQTITPTITPSSTITPSATRTITATTTPTMTPTPTATRTFTNTPSSTITQTFSPTATRTPACRTAGTTTILTSGYAAVPAITGNKVTINNRGRVTYFAVYLSNSGTAGAVQMALYAAPGVPPGALVISSTAKTAVAGWNYLTCTSQTINPGTYWLMLQANNTSVKAVTGLTQDLFIQSPQTVFNHMPVTIAGRLFYQRYHFSTYLQVCN